MPSAWNVLLLADKLVSSGRLGGRPGKGVQARRRDGRRAVAVRLTPEPVAVSEPPVMARGPSTSTSRQPTVSDPPVTDSVSLALVVTLLTDRESPARMTIVAAPVAVDHDVVARRGHLARTPVAADIPVAAGRVYTSSPWWQGQGGFPGLPATVAEAARPVRAGGFATTVFSRMHASHGDLPWYPGPFLPDALRKMSLEAIIAVAISASYL